MRVAAGAAHAAMLGDQAFELLVAASARAEAAGDRSAAAIALADAAAFAGRAPGTIEQAHAPTELDHDDRARSTSRPRRPGGRHARGESGRMASHPGTALADAALGPHGLAPTSLARSMTPDTSAMRSTPSPLPTPRDGRLRGLASNAMERLAGASIASPATIRSSAASSPTSFHMTSESPSSPVSATSSPR